MAPTALGHLTSAVQLGFIFGTLAFAILTISDRFSPSKVFLVCALAGAAFNLGILGGWNSFASLFGFRFLTGFCLAGIYPVGMKIAADHHEKGLGKALGWLVGALVLGTAFPHLLNSYVNQLDWRYVIMGTSSIASFGGLLLYLSVGDGPYRRAGQGLDQTAFFKVFRSFSFRQAAFGYFGHMWELYAFWAFVPAILLRYQQQHGDLPASIAALAFWIIASGSLSCILGGYLSTRIGSRRTAYIALALSGFCCLISPWLFNATFPIFYCFLLVWGMVVIADSPQFSTLVATNAPAEIKGTALTIVNCIGFSITIASIQLIGYLVDSSTTKYTFVWLAIGPLFGLLYAGWGYLKFKKV